MEDDIIQKINIALVYLHKPETIADILEKARDEIIELREFRDKAFSDVYGGEDL